MAAAGNEDVTTLTMPDANHLFQEADTGAFSEYARLEPEFIDGLVETVVDWMVAPVASTPKPLPPPVC